MTRKRSGTRPVNSSPTRGTRNIKYRPRGDTKVSVTTHLEHLIALFLTVVRVNNGETLPDRELKMLNDAVFKMIAGTASYYRFRKRNIPRDVILPMLTNSSKAIPLPDAINMLKGFSSQWRSVLEQSDLITSPQPTHSDVEDKDREYNSSRVSKEADTDTTRSH